MRNTLVRIILARLWVIEALRRTDESIDALLDVLTTALSPDLQMAAPSTPRSPSRSVLIEAVTARVIDPLAEMRLGNVPKPVHTEA